MAENNDIPKELVSVIVPIYKVEDYLDKCIQSVVQQTYKNIEIILVDDGSPDHCPQKCDEWSKKDCRIRVFHKTNGGLSDARNYGLRQVRGELICFVDSDDWIETDMIECLVNGIHMGAEMAICGFYTNYNGHIKKEGYRHGWRYGQKEMLLDRTDGMRLLMSDEIPNFAWNKIYKKGLFEGEERICFPKGSSYEDVAVMYLLMDRCDKIVIMEKPLYHYEYRDTGITGARKMKDLLDHCEIRYRRLKWSQMAYPDMTEIQCDSIADRLVRMTAANIRDVFFRKTDRNTRAIDKKRRVQLAKIIRQDDPLIYNNLHGLWKSIYRLIMMNTLLTDLAAIVLELLRRSGERGDADNHSCSDI